MAAIGHRRAAQISLSALLALAFLQSAYGEDPSAAARSQVAGVAEALTDNDAAEAISHFDKSYPDYVKLRRDFEGLSAFQVENQLNVTEEEDTDKGVFLTITWDITLNGLTTNQTRRRTAEIHATVARVGSKWRIVAFGPLDIFNPEIHSGS